VIDFHLFFRSKQQAQQPQLQKLDIVQLIRWQKLGIPKQGLPNWCPRTARYPLRLHKCPWRCDKK